LGEGALLRPDGLKLKAESGEGLLESKPTPHQLGGMGSALTSKLPQQGLRQSFDRKFILDALRAQKTCLMAANVVSLWQIDAC